MSLATRPSRLSTAPSPSCSLTLPSLRRGLATLVGATTGAGAGAAAAGTGGAGGAVRGVGAGCAAGAAAAPLNDGDGDGGASLSGRSSGVLVLASFAASETCFKLPGLKKNT